MPKQTHGNWALYVMNADGSGEQRLTRSAARTFNDALAWSPTSK